MAYPYSITTRAAGSTLTANIYNADHQNHPDSQTPQNTNDYSNDATQMQVTTDPYPASVASLATSLDGELARLRYIIKQMTGRSQWYVDPITLTATGNILFHNTTVTGGAGAGDIIITNAHAVRCVNAGGTTTVATPYIDAGNRISVDSVMRYNGTNSTAATTVILGANSPATLAATAPYTWFTMIAADGTTVFVPAWK